MNPFDEFLQRILGRQPAQPQIPQAPFAPQQPLTLPNQPFSAPTPTPAPQQSFLPQALRTGLAALVTPNPIASAITTGILDGAPQREAWNAFLPDVQDGRLQSSAERVAAMNPEQQFQVFSDVGGMVNPMAALSVGTGPMASNMFSRMLRTIQEAPFSRGTAAQWLSELEKKSPKGEREWTGIADVLKSDPQRMIHKAELEELAEKKGIRIVEHVEGPENVYADFVQPGQSSNYRMISLVLDQPKELKDAMGNLQTELKRLEDVRNDLGEKLNSIEDRLHDEYDIGWYEMDGYRRSRTPTYRESIIKDYGEDAAALLDEWRNLTNQSENLFDEASNKKQDLQELFDAFDFPQQQQGHSQPINTLAHIRLTDRIIDGRKVLFVEEIQSDWHQAAQKKAKRTLSSGEVVEEKVGYRDLKKEKELARKFQALLEERLEIRKQLDERANLTREQADKFLARIDEIEKELDPFFETDNFSAANRPFFGPFSNTSEWSELALKKVLQEAVDGGYDQVALVTGQQAVDVVGGKVSGMQGFYDLVTPSGKTGVLPATLKDYAKKLGVKLEMEQGNILGTSPERAKELANYNIVFKITPDVKSAVGKGQRLWSTGAGAGIGSAMELLRQRQGLPPKKEEKKKK